MMDNEDLRLRVVSSISDEYIEEITAERINAKKKVAKKKKIFTSIASIAAAIFIILGASLPIIIFGGKQVPVYTGMTVSSEFPLSSPETAEAINAVPCSRLTHRAPLPLGKPLKDAAKDYFNITAAKAQYYANPGDDIYITITFDNPDDFVILSFTLNGKSYSSYMFEEGSDMENIVLKVNVGDVPGPVSYTIDAIKYVDGDKIKDVKIGGDRTVNIGIYNDNQPTADISDMNITTGAVSFSVNVLDPAALIAATEGRIYAILYDGDEVISKRELQLGQTKSISFNELSSTKEYTVAIVAVFDAYNGSGTDAHVLCSTGVSTYPAISPVFVKIEGRTVYFELQRRNDLSDFIKVELISADGTVILSSESEISKFENIPRGRFFLRVTSSYTSGAETKLYEEDSAEFFSLAGIQPTVGTIIKDYSDEPVYNSTMGDMREHKAVDISAQNGSAVYSMSSGVVNNTYCDDHFGFTVEITDEFGYKYLYQCLNENFSVSVGDTVREGDQIGTVGASAITEILEGDHLHFVMLDPNGNAIKPEFSSMPEIEEATPQEKIQKVIDDNTWLKSRVLYKLIPDWRDEEKIQTEYVVIIANGDSGVSAAYSLDSEYAEIILHDPSGFLITYDFTDVTEPTEIHVTITLTCDNTSVELDCVISLCYTIPE